MDPIILFTAVLQDLRSWLFTNSMDANKIKTRNTDEADIIKQEYTSHVSGQDQDLQDIVD